MRTAWPGKFQAQAGAPGTGYREFSKLKSFSSVVEVHLDNYVFKRGSCKELKKLYQLRLLQSNIP